MHKHLNICWLENEKVCSGRLLLILFYISYITDMSVLTSIERLWAWKELSRKQTATNENIVRACWEAVLDWIQIHMGISHFQTVHNIFWSRYIQKMNKCMYVHTHTLSLSLLSYQVTGKLSRQAEIALIISIVFQLEQTTSWNGPFFVRNKSILPYTA